MNFAFLKLYLPIAIMKFTLLVIVFVLLVFKVAAQENGTTIRDVYKTKRHWELGLSHGFVRPTISPEFGPRSAYAINGRVFDLGLGYTFNAAENLGFTATGKAGAYPITLGIPPTAYSYGIDSKQYFMYASYTIFAELAGTASYRYFLNDRFALISGAGFGAKFIAPTSVGAGFGTSPAGSHSKFVLRNNGDAKPFLLAESGLHYKLKNSDLVGLKLSFHYSLKPVQEGTYYIASNSPDYSYGSVEFKGHQLSLALLYTFTGYEKLQRRMTSESPGNKRELKRTIKREYFEKRLAKSSAVRIYGGLFATQNTAADPNNVIQSSRPAGLGYGADFYRAFQPNFFWETGFNYHEYREGSRYHYPGFGKHGFSSNAFEALQLSAGGGYILRNKNLVALFYFSGGAALGYITRTYLGWVGGSEFRMTDPVNNRFLAAVGEDYMDRRVFPLVYAGIRKDLRIRNRLFFVPGF